MRGNHANGRCRQREAKNVLYVATHVNAISTVGKWPYPQKHVAASEGFLQNFWPLCRKCLFLQPNSIFTMEELLHYTWRHRLLPIGDLYTTDGRLVEVIDPGLHNRNAGPDFFNAKVRVGGTLWVGNVELHLRSADWYAHGHDRNAQYNNVVLHVVCDADCEVLTEDGRYLPQLVVPIADGLRHNYEELLRTDRYPPCYKVVPELNRLTVHAWMAALQTER